MAKKNELTYLQSPLPEGRKYYKSTKVSFSGLNKRHTLDTGVLSYEKNISTVEAPCLTPSPRPRVLDFHNEETRLSIWQIFGFDDFLVVLYQIGSGNILIDYVDDEGVFATGDLGTSEKVARSVVQFNVYDTPTDILGGEYVKKLLIFPDKKSVDLHVERNHKTPTSLTLASLETDTLKLPNIKYATVHLSRVFGVDDDRVYASGFNDYANWNLDTADEYNESNAWCSPAQSNVKADSNFTGITTYQNHVVCFKRNYMHELYNTKNPFRIQDLYQIGTIDHRTIQEVNGRLIFVSDNNVMMYTGSSPQIIGYNLNRDKYLSGKMYSTVSGTDGRNYYLFTLAVSDDSPFQFLVYDTLIGEWSERSISFPASNADDTYAEWGKITSFAHNRTGMYMSADTTEGFKIYKLDTTDYSGHKWAFETDLMTNQTVDTKHIKKLQMLGDFDNCNLDVYILYDDEVFNAETSHKVYSRTKLSGKKPIRVKPRNTAHYGFKLHFEGVGYAKLYELEIFAQQGGDLYV